MPQLRASTPRSQTAWSHGDRRRRRRRWQRVGGAALVRTSVRDFLVARTAQDAFTALTATCTHEACTITGFQSPDVRLPVPRLAVQHERRRRQRTGDACAADLRHAVRRHHALNHVVTRCTTSEVSPSRAAGHRWLAPDSPLGSPRASRAQAPAAWQAADGEIAVLCPLTVGGSFEARTTAVAGRLAIDQSQPGALTGELQVDLQTLDTGIGLRNTHLREKYLEVGKGDGLRSRRAVGDRRRGRGSRRPAPGKGTFKGMLALHGTRKPVERRGAADAGWRPRESGRHVSGAAARLRHRRATVSRRRRARSGAGASEVRRQGRCFREHSMTVACARVLLVTVAVVGVVCARPHRPSRSSSRSSIRAARRATTRPPAVACSPRTGGRCRIASCRRSASRCRRTTTRAATTR